MYVSSSRVYCNFSVRSRQFITKIRRPQNPEEAENMVYPFCVKMVSSKLSTGGV